MDKPKERFTSRWSRLKREPEDANPSDAEAKPSDDHSKTDAATFPESESHPQATEKPDAELTDPELLEKYALPDPDSMMAGDDFSAFMNKAVPDRLRRRALRVLWGSNPILANLDELVDYGEDYTDAATVIENMQTIYQVGKGSAWKFQEEQARVAEAKAAAEAEAAERRAHNGEPVDDLALTEPTDEEEDPELTELEPEVDMAELSEEQPEALTPLRPRPRPMQFEFE